MSASDQVARGFVRGHVDALRYPNAVDADPSEAHEIIAQQVPLGSRVLDVGCGAGALMDYLQKRRKAVVVGIEPEHTRAETAAAQGLEVIESAFSADSAGALEPFDVVLFADVLEHLSDPHEALTVARSLLKDGGRVVASVPNVAHWTVRWNLMRGRFDYQPSGIMDATHLRWFTRSTLLSLFRVAGLEPYRVCSSTGKWMPDYRQRRPWRWLDAPTRGRALDALARRWPTMFGCQHIVTATRALDKPL
jgi:methionine biosynthesis protein MetW